MSETKTEQWFEIDIVRPDSDPDFGPMRFGPYAQVSHVRMAMKLNRSLRWRLSQGWVHSVRKVTRTYTDQIETVEL